MVKLEFVMVKPVIFAVLYHQTTLSPSQTFVDWLVVYILQVYLEGGPLRAVLTRSLAIAGRLCDAKAWQG